MNIYCRYYRKYKSYEFGKCLLVPITLGKPKLAKCECFRKECVLNKLNNIDRLIVKTKIKNIYTLNSSYGELYKIEYDN